MNTEFAIAEVMPDKLNALVENIMPSDRRSRSKRKRFASNSGEWVVSKQTHSWREEDGVIYFSVTSDGTTGEDWITRLEQGLLRGRLRQAGAPFAGFKPTNGVTTEVAVLKGRLFEDNDRITKKIRAEAYKRKLSSRTPSSLASSVRSSRTRRSKRWVCGTSLPCTNPSTTPTGDPHLLYARRYDVGRWLNAYYDRPGDRWHRDHGFAFAVSQVSSQPPKILRDFSPFELSP